jgi:hypothetical protein
MSSGSVASQFTPMRRNPTLRFGSNDWFGAIRPEAWFLTFSRKEISMRIAFFLAAFGTLFGVCVAARCAPPVPGELKPGSDESLAMIVAAKGVQIYECRAKAGASGVYEWAFVAPEAQLFGADGKLIGKHYAGPHWEAADGSKVVGTQKARSNAPHADSIPWLLLATKSDGPEGLFGKVSSIQRLNTVGGVAPTGGCSEATAGATARVAYTADYYLFSRK